MAGCPVSETVVTKFFKNKNKKTLKPEAALGRDRHVSLASCPMNHSHAEKQHRAKEPHSAGSKSKALETLSGLILGSATCQSGALKSSSSATGFLRQLEQPRCLPQSPN